MRVGDGVSGWVRELIRFLVDLVGASPDDRPFKLWIKCHYMRQLEAEMLKVCERMSPVDAKWIPAMNAI